MKYLKARLCLPCLIVLIQLSDACAQAPDASIRLPNGWSLSPAGTSISLGDLPLAMSVSSSGKWMAVTNNGQSQQNIQLIDPAGLKVVDSIRVHAAWLGLTFSADEHFLFASGGNDNFILQLGIKEGHLTPYDTLRLGKAWPEKISPAGLAIDDKTQLLYVVTKENNSLYIFDINQRKVVGQYALPSEGYACLLSTDHRKLYVSCWGASKVKVFDTAKRIFTKDYPVGDHPNDMCLARKSELLFVANANDNSVSVINLRTDKVVETLNAALYPQAPSGSTTNSVALSKDEHTLYVANADNN
ncbi:MAG TPA: YncE family protein, partial [Bacteroidia bacterium]|nr:YncE family protein [Bacteroidia bacterium]